MNDRHPFKMEGLCLYLCLHVPITFFFFFKCFHFFSLCHFLLQLQPLYKPSLLLKLLQTPGKRISFEVVK